jgi:hypothetical protein
MSVIDKKFGRVPKGALIYHLGLLEQWPQLRLMRLLCGREILVQA